MGKINEKESGVFDGELDKGIKWHRGKRGIMTEKLGEHSSICIDSGFENIRISGPTVEAVRRGIENLLINPELYQIYRDMSGEIIVDEKGDKTGFFPIVVLRKDIVERHKQPK